MEHATAGVSNAQRNADLLTGNQVHRVHERIQPRIGRDVGARRSNELERRSVDMQRVIHHAVVAHDPFFRHTGLHGDVVARRVERFAVDGESAGARRSPCPCPCRIAPRSGLWQGSLGAVAGQADFREA